MDEGPLLAAGNNDLPVAEKNHVFLLIRKGLVIVAVSNDSVVTITDNHNECFLYD